MYHANALKKGMSPDHKPTYRHKHPRNLNGA